MMHVNPADEPPSFDKDVRVPGQRAVAEMVGKIPQVSRKSGRPHKQRSRKVKQSDGTLKMLPITREEDLPADQFPSFWTNALDNLMESYDQLCAYSCFRIHQVTGARSVDHMAPKSRIWNQVYEWKNYRLCCSLLNARKSNFGDVLDPFEVEDGWFEMEFVGYQVLPARNLEESTKQEVLATIKRLKLNEAAFRNSREYDVENYEKGVPFAVLMEESPFVARELRRQGRLRIEDS